MWCCLATAAVGTNDGGMNWSGGLRQTVNWEGNGKSEQDDGRAHTKKERYLAGRRQSIRKE